MTRLHVPLSGCTNDTVRDGRDRPVIDERQRGRPRAGSAEQAPARPAGNPRRATALHRDPSERIAPALAPRPRSSRRFGPPRPPSGRTGRQRPRLGRLEHPSRNSQALRPHAAHDTLGRGLETIHHPTSLTVGDGRPETPPAAHVLGDMPKAGREMLNGHPCPCPTPTSQQSPPPPTTPTQPARCSTTPPRPSQHAAAADTA